MHLVCIVAILWAIPVTYATVPGTCLHYVERKPNIEKRQGGVFPVLGIAALGTSIPHPRLEIRELEKNEDQWNVYLLGLRRLQNVTQDGKLSYYQIAGIHGRPLIAWDGVAGDPSRESGYCQHGSNIFSTWHRPYLALFEEVVYLNARQSISEFPNGERKNRYYTALSTFRIPYWDWAAIPAAGQGAFPSSVQRPTITLTLPSGPTTVPNPLYSYNFHPLPRSDFTDDRFDTWPCTVRAPLTDDVKGASRNDVVALDLNKSRANLQSGVYDILAFQHDYYNVSSTESIEFLHNTVHNLIGGDGHMSSPPYAAFDPIFWLHHANVDRLFAIWQALNPDSYVTPNPILTPTFTMPQGSVADINTPLHPFHKDDSGNFWTSETVRNHTVFGYTYPDLVDLGVNATSTLISRMNALYGPNAAPRDARIMDATTINGAPSFASQRQYVVNVNVHQNSLNGSFNIYVFLGDAPTSAPQTWSDSASFVGIIGIFATKGAMAPDGPDRKAKGGVPLTAALEAKARSGELECLREDVVAEYLRANLKWKISKTNSEEISVDAALGFEIAVLWAEVQPAMSASEFPSIKGHYQVLVGATDGRAGGF